MGECLTFGKESGLYEPRLYKESGQQEAQRWDDVKEGSCGRRVSPEATRTAASERYDARRIGRARADAATQLVAVVGKVAHFEEGGRQEQGEYEDGGAGEGGVSVQLEAGRGARGPSQRQVLCKQEQHSIATI